MLNLHALWPHSCANGPGIRMVLWFQGCTLRCSGCFNPDTHAAEPRWQVSVEELMGRNIAIEHVPAAEVWIDAAGNISITGIEPPSIAGFQGA
jgi:pyruvate-formate lyase-activating enzyme